MRRWCDRDGQAASEYVALVALVAVVLALAAGLTTGGVSGQVLAGLQRGLCRVTGTACARPSVAADVLAPCPVERTTNSETLAGAFTLVKLDESGMLSAVRTSDGRVAVTLASGKSIGGEAGLGVWLRTGGRRRGVGATGTLEARVSSGRSWLLSDAAAARAFVARYGAKATLAGKAVDVVRSGCSLLCDALGWHPHATLPPADEVFVDQGLAARVGAPLGFTELAASASALLGARLLADGGSTWYLQLDAVADALLPSSGGVGASAQHQAVVSYQLDARRRPVGLTVERVGQDAAAASLGARAGGGRVRAGAGGGVARVTELEATLDLHDPRNRAAAVAFVAALRRPFALAELRRSADAVHERIARTGVVNRRTYALSSSAFALGGKVAVGRELSGGFERTRARMRLVSAETRLPGLPFLPRDDCRPPA